MTDHDVAAFVDVVQERIGAPAGSYIHYGLTSSDVVDTALCATLTRAADLLLGRPRRVRRRPQGPGPRARCTSRWPGAPTACTPSPPPSGPSSRCGRCRPTATAGACGPPATAIAVGKLSGAVGTYSNIDPAVEARVCAALGLTPVPATQVIARDRHAEYLYACASIGATIELMCTEIRHLARSEVGEAEEPFGAGPEGQLGHAAQAQPDPLGAPVRPGPPAARLPRAPGSRTWPCGTSATSRTARSSGSSLPDASLLTCYMLRKATGLAAGLVVHPERALAEPDRGLARPRLLPVGPPGAGLGRADPRRGLPDRPARRPRGLGGAAALPRRARGRRRGHARRRAARRGLRPRRARCATSTASPTRWRTL